MIRLPQALTLQSSGGGFISFKLWKLSQQLWLSSWNQFSQFLVMDGASHYYSDQCQIIESGPLPVKFDSVMIRTFDGWVWVCSIGRFGRNIAERWLETFFYDMYNSLPQHKILFKQKWSTKSAMKTMHTQEFYLAVIIRVYWYVWHGKVASSQQLLG